MHICICGKEFIKWQSLNAHKGHCSLVRKSKGLSELVPDRFGDARAWSRNITKEDPRYKSFKKFINSGSDYRKSFRNLLINWNKNKPKESYLHQSITRKLRYAEGSLVPAPGIGRGKYSYFNYKDNRYLLRSTYEFIFALYLADSDKEFQYESVRVVFKNKTFISDFVVDNIIFEIKAIKDAKSNLVLEAFKSEGYNILVYDGEYIDILRDHLSSKYDLNSMINRIIKGHNDRTYAEFFF